jgi:alkyl sulfatase BDS1-like metallo-beta-lactamase superfamily hydrolase
MSAEFVDRADVENADRGFVASLDPMAIEAADGPKAWTRALPPTSPSPSPAASSLGSWRAKADGVAIDGDAGVLTSLIGLLDQPDPTFAIVTPWPLSARRPLPIGRQAPWTDQP